jgi:hypothetical protein
MVTDKCIGIRIRTMLGNGEKEHNQDKAKFGNREI